MPLLSDLFGIKGIVLKTWTLGSIFKLALPVTGFYTRDTANMSALEMFESVSDNRSTFGRDAVGRISDFLTFVANLANIIVHWRLCSNFSRYKTVLEAW
jgi:hypothetical protein